MAKIVAKYKIDTSTDTIELYLPEDADGNTELDNVVSSGPATEYVSGTVDGAAYSGYKFVDQIIVNEGLEDELITTAKLAALSVSTEKLAELVVTSGKIATGQIDWATHMSGAASQPEDYASDNRTSIPSTVQLDGTGTLLSTLDTTSTNFNARNDRDATAVVAPTIASDGTAVDHVANTDGSCDISLEWTWGGTEADIDGFIVYIRSSTSATSYNFGTTQAEEHAFFIPASKRAFFFYGSGIDNYYTFGVQAYRNVDPDVSASGIILSTISQPALGAEDPYRPATEPTFSGDITGTLNGAAFGNLASEDLVTADFVGANMIAVGTAAIATGAISSAHIGDAEITNAKLDRASANKISIVDADINDLSAGKITAGTIVSGVSITDSLSALNTSTGALTVDGTATVQSTLNISTGGVLKSGQTAYNTGTGYWFEYNSGTPRMSIGTSSEGVTWNGSSFTINGDVVATGNVNANGITATDSGHTSSVSGTTADAEIVSTGNISLYTGSPVNIVVIGSVTAQSLGGSVDCTVYLRRNSTNILTLANVTATAGGSETKAFDRTYIDSSGTGTVDYNIYADNNGVQQWLADNCSILAIHTKR